MGGKFKREGTYVYLWLMHDDIWQKTTKFCKAIILQLKNKLIKKHTHTGIPKPLVAKSLFRMPLLLLLSGKVLEQSRLPSVPVPSFAHDECLCWLVYLFLYFYMQAFSSALTRDWGSDVQRLHPAHPRKGILLSSLFCFYLSLEESLLGGERTSNSEGCGCAFLFTQEATQEWWLFCRVLFCKICSLSHMMLQGLSHKSRIKSLATSLSSNSKFLSVNFCISEHLPSENSPIQCLGSKILSICGFKVQRLCYCQWLWKKPGR